MSSIEQKLSPGKQFIVRSAAKPVPKPEESVIVTAGTTPSGNPYPGLLIVISAIPDASHSILYDVQGVCSNRAEKLTLLSSDVGSVQQG